MGDTLALASVRGASALVTGRGGGGRGSRGEWTDSPQVGGAVVRGLPYFHSHDDLSSALWSGLGSVSGRLFARQTVNHVSGTDFGIASEPLLEKAIFALGCRRGGGPVGGEGAESNSQQVAGG